MNGAGQDRKAVIVISSHVARGAVGNRAAVFALETLGFTVWAAPTVILPWHPGHGQGTRIVPPGPEFAALLNDLGTTPAAGEVTAVMTGYFADAAQVEAAASIVKALRARNPELLYLCDPVIGDANGRYVAEPVAQAIRDRLMPMADIATPNRFELEWLAGKALESNAAIMNAAALLKPPRLLATSAHPMIANGTANLLVTANKALLAEHRHVEGAPSGTGDLMAALFLARLLAGEPDDKALSRAAASVFEIVARSVKQGADELLLPQEASSLSHPMAMVSLRQLARPRPKP